MRSMQTFLISNHCHSRCGLSDAFILCYKRQNQISKLILFLCNYVLMMMFKGIVTQVNGFNFKYFFFIAFSS